MEIIMATKKMIFIIVIGTVFCVTTCQSKQTKSKEVTESSIEMDTTTIKVNIPAIVINTITSDSLELTGLIRKMLKWNETDGYYDFGVVRSSPEDSVYSEINWEMHNRRMQQLKETDFFTMDFLENYQNIAVHLDKELKENLERYYVGDLPPYGNGANEWCNCQDFPTNWENNLMIVDLKINANSASFNWTWYKEYYNFVQAQKVDNSWRISYIELFDIKNFTW